MEEQIAALEGELKVWLPRPPQALTPALPPPGRAPALRLTSLRAPPCIASALQSAHLQLEEAEKEAEKDKARACKEVEEHCAGQVEALQARPAASRPAAAPGGARSCDEGVMTRRPPSSEEPRPLARRAPQAMMVQLEQRAARREDSLRTEARPGARAFCFEAAYYCAEDTPPPGTAARPRRCRPTLVGRRFGNSLNAPWLPPASAPPNTRAGVHLGAAAARGGGRQARRRRRQHRRHAAAHPRGAGAQTPPVPPPGNRRCETAWRNPSGARPA